MPPRTPRLPSARLSRKPRPLSSSPSAVALGTSFERSSLAALQVPPFRFTALARSGGAGDGGVDLRGIWRGRPLLPSLIGGRGQANEPGWRVVVQCKAYRAKLGPVVVRELEGAVLAEPAKAIPFTPSSPFPSSPAALDVASNSTTATSPIVGLLVSLSGFSGDAIKRAETSTLPLVLVHLAAPTPGALEAAATAGGALAADEMEIRGVSYSRVLLDLVRLEKERSTSEESRCVENGTLALG